MKLYQYLACIGVVSVAAASCQHAENTTEKKVDSVCVTDSMAKQIRIDSAAVSNIDDELNLSGEVNFDDNKVVKVFPFSSGQVLETRVSLGDRVTQGQTLAVIKSAEIAGSYSDLLTAGNDLAIAKKQMENTESLYKNGISSEREYTEAKETYNKALESSNKIQNQITINGGGRTSANGTYIIKAPISGYVVEKKINQGAFIRNDNTENLFTIGDIKDVWVWANVYESDISRVKEGYTARISTLSYPGRVFKGVVDKVNQLLDPESKVMKIRIKLNNDSLLLKPEMFASVNIENKEKQKAISIPASSIVSENGKNYVVLYRSNCDLKVVPVDITKTVDDKTYISSGLDAGDRVISKNQILFYRALTED